MVWVNKETNKLLRDTLKKEFPTYKFKVNKRDFNSLTITLQQADINVIECIKDYSNQRKFFQENGYLGCCLTYCKEYIGKLGVLFQKMDKITNDIFCIRYRETGDYGMQPNIYIYLNIGEYKNPYKQI